MTLPGGQTVPSLPWVSHFHRVIGRTGDAVTGYHIILVSP